MPVKWELKHVIKNILLEGWKYVTNFKLIVPEIEKNINSCRADLKCN